MSKTKTLLCRCLWFAGQTIEFLVRNSYYPSWAVKIEDLAQYLAFENINNNTVHYPPPSDPIKCSKVIVDCDYLVVGHISIYQTSNIAKDLVPDLGRRWWSFVAGSFIFRNGFEG
ncbi:hypothetical protein TWF788_003197 [Orbilia oligospora]|uniref:Uncharacterized protein n=1 Tax=Orbilia oligospora TaxID=2813651 RepID=A0A7C8K3G9_ORBOL|nr:hypothetical protein TWF788_003197 [Orbilia oligospora]